MRIHGMTGASPVTTIHGLRGKPRSGGQYSSDRACPCQASTGPHQAPSRPCHAQVFMVSFVLLALTLFLSTTPALAASHDQPAQSQTLVAGPYTVVMGLSVSQPIVDQDMTVTITPHTAVQLSGTLQALPGAGTDGIVVRRTLVTDAVQPQMLVSTIRMPVRGAWTLVLNLDGPQGTGTASMDIIVAAPNAIPPWEGWMIGLLPLIGFIWLIWRQWVYRRSLLKQAYQK